MTIDQQPELYLQQGLLELGDTSSGTLELLPKLWFAAEALSSSKVSDRRTGLEMILEQRAPRISPLLTYLLFTRITDPDLEIRKLVVEALVDVMGPDDEGLPAAESVRVNLHAHLSQMESSKIIALLEAAAFDPSVEPNIDILIKTCTDSGNILADIANDRTQSINIRELAIILIGRIGCLDAQPTLERLASRLESKMNGQQVMPFNRVDEKHEVALLPSIRIALDYLRAP